MREQREEELSGGKSLSSSLTDIGKQRAEEISSRTYCIFTMCPRNFVCTYCRFGSTYNLLSILTVSEVTLINSVKHFLAVAYVSTGKAYYNWIFSLLVLKNAM